MEQFNLEKYLENPSRKVVTRDGRSVRIICTDIIGHFPIVAAIKLEVGNEFIKEYDLRGRACLSNEDCCDLFFADEEEELTEFERELINAFDDAQHHTASKGIVFAKKYKEKLLDLAKKEIIKEIEQKAINHTYDYQNGYENGKYDALKELPKWEKAKENRCLPNYAAIMNEDGKIIHSHTVREGEYFIIFQSLETLSKEE